MNIKLITHTHIHITTHLLTHLPLVCIHTLALHTYPYIENQIHVYSYACVQQTFLASGVKNLLQGSNCNLVFTLDLKESSSLTNREVRGFFPQCCCVVSKAPYFYATKEILSW